MALTQVTSAGLKDGEIVNADLHSAASVALSKLASTGALGSAVTATTQSASDNSTKIATTAFVQAAVTSLIDGAPGSLNTLNELAAAINDDSSYATTLTTALATKLPLAGGTLTGSLTVSGDVLFDNGTNSGKDILFDASANKLEFSDDVIASFGNSGDLQIHHVNAESANYITSKNNVLYICGKTGQTAIQIVPDAATDLRYAGGQKLITTSLGARVVGDLQMGNTAGVRFHHAGTTSIFETQTAGDSLLFKTTPSGGSTTERIRVTSGGLILLGSSTSDLSGNHSFISIGSRHALQYEASAGTYLSFIMGSADGDITLDANARSGAYPPLIFKVGGSERLRINSSGAVSIASNNYGAGHSSAKLRVGTESGSTQGTVVFGSGDTTTPALTLTNWDGAQTSNWSVIQFDNSGWGNFQIGGTAGADAFSIYDDTVERLRINSSGHLILSPSGYSLPTGDERTLNIVAWGSKPASLGFQRSNSLGGSTCGWTNELQSNGDLLWGIHNVGEKLRLTSGGQIKHSLGHSSGNSAHVDTSWYGDDANEYTLEHRDFNEIYALKTANANNYASYVYRRETMTSWCDIEFELMGGTPTSYRHLGFAINGDGSDTSGNFDRLVFRSRTGNSSLNQVRLDTSSGEGFNSTGTSVPQWFDGTWRHVLLQIRGDEYGITVDGVRKFSFTSSYAAARASGYFGFTMYEASTDNNPWVKLKNFKIRNYSKEWASPQLSSAGNDDAIQVMHDSHNKWGKMIGKRIHNTSSASSKNVDILNINSWQSTNSRIIVKVNVMAISPVAEIGFFAYGSAYCRRGGSNTTAQSHNVNTMSLEHRFGNSSAYGSLDWNGMVLRYQTPAVAYLDMHVDVEYHGYDGVVVTFPTKYIVAS